MPRIVDISAPLSPSGPVFPGDPVFVREVLAAFPGSDYELARLAMSAHAGTHLDAPAHFVPGGRRLDDYPPEAFALPALVVETPDAPLVLAGHLAGAAPPPGGALLLKTSNSRRGLMRRPGFTADYAALSAEGARACLAAGAGLVGIDYLSVDPPGAGGFPAHRVLLGAGCLILEGLDLSAAPAGPARLVCPPLAVSGAEAAPCRALLFLD